VIVWYSKGRMVGWQMRSIVNCVYTYTNKHKYSSPTWWAAQISTAEWNERTNVTNGINNQPTYITNQLVSKPTTTTTRAYIHRHPYVRRRMGVTEAEVAQRALHCRPCSPRVMNPTKSIMTNIKHHAYITPSSRNAQHDTVYIESS